YAMSDLYVMPSVSEPFGIAPLEAMLYDVPIIVSKQSGVAEILDYALKVDFWDTDKLADSIVSLLTQPAMAEEMVKNNTQQLSQIKWSIAADKTLDVYRSLTGGM
ncbi:MAG: glycosyltransferase family 4 protein, partial [Candidatus Aminicenantes bacterium]|nr:glycosyltransferase family 4 protein [Candidatus Aminicenantes bacterium]